jgi:flagellar basal-body rod modification protein FlgD
MTASVASTGPNPSTGGVSNATASNSSSSVTKDMFLKLLVAQIRNQDPLNPADGVQFLTQLAQFSQLEQTLGMSTDLAAIRKDLDQLIPKPASGSQS